MAKLKRLRSDNSRGLYCKITPELMKRVKTLNLLGKDSIKLMLPTYFNPYKDSRPGINAIKLYDRWGAVSYRKLRGRCAIGWQPGTNHGDLREWTLWIDNALPF